MKQVFVNLSLDIQKAITTLLAKQNVPFDVVKRAVLLHDRYMQRKNGDEHFLHDFTDVLAYLSLRAPATYAQTYATLGSVQAMVPSWQPKTMLDIGSGPGVGIWAANALWPEIKEALCLDMDTNMLSVGKQLAEEAKIPVNIAWGQFDVRQGFADTDTQYDLVVLANVLNELSVSEGEKLIGQAYNRCRGILVIVESGTPFGSSIVQSAAKKLSHAGTLLAPYIANTFVQDKTYWLHFSQRFQRPEFQRRVRQHMRESLLMASDWEEAKYAYVAIAKMPPEIQAWGRCVGPIQKQKGFLEVPVLTQDQLLQVKVMKRHKQQYTFAKELRWGNLIIKPEELLDAEFLHAL